MNYELKRIAPFHAARVVGFITFVMVWCAYLADWAKFLMNAHYGEPKIDGLLSSSCILALVSFVVAAVACLVYNGLARMIGGLQVQIEPGPEKT